MAGGCEYDEWYQVSMRQYPRWRASFCSPSRKVKTHCWPRTWRSGVKLQDLDVRIILGEKDNFLPVLEHRLLSEGSGENASTCRMFNLG